MPAAATVASQTPAGPASIWESPCVYSALESTGKVPGLGCCFLKVNPHTVVILFKLRLEHLDT